jgi:hypothetical protein
MSERSAVEFVRQALDYWKRGAYTDREIPTLFIEVAAEVDPSDLAPHLPAELLEELHTLTKIPPDDPFREGWVYFGNSWENYHRGAWRWHV